MSVKGNKPIELSRIIWGEAGTGVSNWQQAREVFTHGAFRVVYGTAVNELMDNIQYSLEV